jgi:hypothetical protein
MRTKGALEMAVTLNGLALVGDQKFLLKKKKKNFIVASSRCEITKHLSSLQRPETSTDLFKFF